MLASLANFYQNAANKWAGRLGKPIPDKGCSQARMWSSSQRIISLQRFQISDKVLNSRCPHKDFGVETKSVLFCIADRGAAGAAFQKLSASCRSLCFCDHWRINPCNRKMPVKFRPESFFGVGGGLGGREERPCVRKETGLRSSSSTEANEFKGT